MGGVEPGHRHRCHHGRGPPTVGGNANHGRDPGHRKDPIRRQGPRPWTGTPAAGGRARRPPEQTPTRLTAQDEPPGQRDTLLCQQGT